ncbi:MAG TPA: hypothetical protein VFW29_12825 [Solirubrobacteraceae bacterium]|nr:hypothetical protein [Solirubrobacteraceae bacterium]
MIYRKLAWAPPAIVAAFAIVWALTPASARDPALVVEIELSKGLAVLGCVAAALAFDREDYLRRAWLLLGASTVLLFARDVFALSAQPGPADTAPLVVEGTLAIAGNGCSVVGTWMLASAWRVAGLEDESSRSRETWLLVAAVTLAVLVTGLPLASDVRALGRGEVFAVVPLASDVADAVVLSLLAPLAQTAIAMRGGLLRWPWALLTASGALWLLFDASYGLVTVLHVQPSAAHPVLEAMRALPTLYGFAAGFAQRGVATHAAA